MKVLEADLQGFYKGEIRLLVVVEVTYRFRV